MRRALAAAAGTAAGLVALLGYKSGPAPSRVAGAAPPTPTTDAPTPTPAPAPDPTSPPSTNRPPRTAAPTPTTAPAPARRTVTGPVVENPYGPVQVAVTIVGRRIVDIRALEYPQDRRRSAEISAEAIPLLREEVLRAQSASIDIVSGATYTSDSYAESLQAALDGARR